MTSLRLAGLAAGLCVLGAGAALAQDVPPEVRGEYAIGSCTAPQVTVTIDAGGLTVTDPSSGSVISSVTVESVSVDGGAIAMDVLVDGNEPGQMVLEDLGGGALNVIYTEDGGGTEPAQRIELCAAAEPTEPTEPVTPADSGVAVPAILIGEFATGSCDAPEESLHIETGRIEAFGSSGNSQGVATVTAVNEIPDGYAIDVEIEGQAGTLELVLINQDIIEAVFLSGGRPVDEVETLFRCTPMVVGAEDTPPEQPETPETPEQPEQPETPEQPSTQLAALPDMFLGEYAAGGTCEAPEATVRFEPNRLVVIEDGREDFVIDILEVSQPAGQIEPGIDFVISADGREGLVEMRSIGGTTYVLTFRDLATGEEDDSETVTLCTPAVTEGPEQPEQPETPEVPVSPGQATLPDAYLGEYALGDSCTDPEVTVVFEADRIVVFENGSVEVEIDVIEVTATSPDLAFAADSGGQIGDVVMQAIGGNQYTVTFTDRETGREDRPETMTLCTPAVTTGTTDGPTAPAASPGQFLFDQPVAQFAALMAELEAVCQPGAEQQCLDTFWAFADLTGDGQLTGPEMARVIRYATKWAVSENLPIVRLGQKLSVHLATMVTGPLVANGMIYNHDYDGNNALSQVELFPDGVASAPMAVPALMELLSESTLEDVVEALEELDRM